MLQTHLQNRHAPVAQLDRAPPSGGGGQRFESSRARHFVLTPPKLAGKKQPDWLRQEDILFAARGSRNYAALIDQEQAQVIAAPQFYILRVNGESLLPEFLAWQLNQRPLQTYFDRAAEGSVTKSVRRAVLGEARINIPPLEKQQQILALYKTLQKEKSLYADLIRNGEKLMNSIASQIMAGKTV